MAPLQTTVIGSFRKPEYLKLPSLVSSETNGFFKDHLKVFNDVKSQTGEDELNQQVERATKEVINLQKEIGIDIVTDGEMRRDDYMFDYMRRHEGFDFVNFEKVSVRNGAYESWLPCITAPIRHRKNTIPEEWALSQSYAGDTPVKYTIPGPMTIHGTSKNNYYTDRKQMSDDLVVCIREDLKALVAAGCKHIQIDEPLLVREPDIALEYGIDALSAILEVVPDDVETTVHMCCGYPQYLDQTDYMKADKNCYSIIAEKLDVAGFSAISFEDTHRRNEPSLFAKYKKSKIVLGVLKIAASEIEPVEEIEEHIRSVLEHVPRERLIIAPDCGVPYLPDHIMKQKLQNMVAAVKSIS